MVIWIVKCFLSIYLYGRWRNMQRRNWVVTDRSCDQGHRINISTNLFQMFIIFKNLLLIDPVKNLLVLQIQIYSLKYQPGNNPKIASWQNKLKLETNNYVIVTHFNRWLVTDRCLYNLCNTKHVLSLSHLQY